MKMIGVLLATVVVAGVTYLYLEPTLRAWLWAFGHHSTATYQGLSVKVPSMWRQEETPAGQRQLRLVRARLGEPGGLVLGQRQVGDKSNEITAVPELLDTLDLKGSIVTLDAMGCQKAIVSKILERGADYLVTLKANQGKIFAAVRDHCLETCFALGASNRPASDEFDDKHGRLVRRRVFACPQAVLLEPLRDWPGLRTVVAVESIRSINGSGKVEAEIRYFLSSCTDAPEMLAKAIRQHWSIENSLHWVLDVTFREDDCRVRDRTAVRNFALLRKIAINLVRRHNSSRNSLRGRRKIAAWNNQYMRQVLTGIFHA